MAVRIVSMVAGATGAPSRYKMPKMPLMLVACASEGSLLSFGRWMDATIIHATWD
jgi:hypothetical protein